jgi:S-DNA-T family DNA segregation ATPase FtsK/SpoIIIE
MPRVLSVSDVRRQLYWAAGGPESAGEGEPSVALLGSLFHQAFGQLTGPDPQVNLSAPLQLADAALESWQRALRTHAYCTCVAPALSTHQANLQVHGAEVIAYWGAVKALCDWIAAVVFEQRRDNESLESVRARIFAAAEQEVCAELSDPSWNDTVIVQGRADAIVAQRGTARQCVVELKLGRTAPEADLLQACLYHLLLAEGQPDLSHLALMAFEPDLREHLFEARQLRDAQTQLKALVWRLAGGEAPRAGPAILPVPQREPAQQAGWREPARTTPSLQPAPGAPPLLGTERSNRVPAEQAAPSDAASRQAEADLAAIGKKLESAFAEFGAPIQLEGTPTAGPTFIRFLAKPRRGVTVRSLTRLAESVWMRLGTSQPPHVALERGRIAIDVEQPQRRSVEFARWRQALPQRVAIGVSRFVVGISVDGQPHFADLAKPESAHFLVAGTSGSGKSEWLRSTLGSLLVSNTTATLKLALIDPKRSAFGAFVASPYLWRPVVYSEGVEELLDALVDEMERRYEALSGARADNLAEYNATGAAPMARIVCVCDEYADLLLADRKRREVVEHLIARLGAKARAAGIHLIFATQRPSRDIVKGVIDANFSGRVALKVVRPMESRIILDETGAETLLGRGDLLYKDIGSPVRLQGLLVTRSELEGLAG